MLFTFSFACLSNGTKATDDCVRFDFSKEAYMEIVEVMEQITEDFKDMEKTFQDEFTKRIEYFIYQNSPTPNPTTLKNKRDSKFEFIMGLFFTHFPSFYDKHSSQINRKICELEILFKESREMFQINKTDIQSIARWKGRVFKLKECQYPNVDIFRVSLENLIKSKLRVSVNELYDSIYTLTVNRHISRPSLRNSFGSKLFVYRVGREGKKLPGKYNNLHKKETVFEEQISPFNGTSESLKLDLIREYFNAKEDDIRFVSLRKKFPLAVLQKLHKTKGSQKKMDEISNNSEYLHDYFKYISYFLSDNPFQKKYKKIVEIIIPNLIRSKGIPAGV